MADEKKNEKKENENNAAFLVALGFGLAMGIGVVLVAVAASATAAAFFTWSSGVMIAVFGGAASRAATALQMTSRAVAIVTPRIRRVVRVVLGLLLVYIGISVFTIIGAHWTGNVVGTARGIAMLTVIPFIVAIAVQWWVYRIGDGEPNPYTMARIPSIVYLSMVQIAAFALYWPQLDPLIPDSVGLAYTVAAIVAAVFSMSSFSVLLMRRRNILFQIWAWASCVLLVISILLQLPLVNAGATMATEKIGTAGNRTIEQLEAGKWERYQVSKTLQLLSLPQDGQGKKVYELSDFTEVEEGQVMAGDEVVLNKEDFIRVEGFPELFHLTRRFKDGELIAEGYLPKDDNLNAVSKQQEEEDRQKAETVKAQAQERMPQPSPVVRLENPTSTAKAVGRDFVATSELLHPPSGSEFAVGGFASRADVTRLQIGLGYQDADEDGKRDVLVLESTPSRIRKRPSDGLWYAIVRAEKQDLTYPNHVEVATTDGEPLDVTVELLLHQRF